MKKDITSLNSQLEIDCFWMEKAIGLAKEAGEQGEVPVGAVIINNNGIVSKAANSPIRLHDPTAHAEILAIRQAAAQLKNYRIPEATLYVTLEPCIMCMGALIHARINRLVYGANDPKTGAAASIYSIGSDKRLNHDIEICSGILADQCGALLKDFFKNRRTARKLAKQK